ncbi:MAG: hypothetical protein FWD39_03395 [Clostridiales bacterium]|nr:hypothetical protein [Clostridiales bacterium]
MSISKKQYLKDRTALHPGRVRLAPVGGDIFDMTLADGPVVEGNRMTAAIIDRIEDTAYSPTYHKLMEFLYSNRLDWQAYYSEVLQSMTIITESGVYTAPRTGAYKIICVAGGQGGQGGQGSAPGNNSQDIGVAGAGGAGGAAGGVSAITLKLTAGTAYTCTIGGGGAGGAAGVQSGNTNTVPPIPLPGALGGATAANNTVSGNPGKDGLGRTLDLLIPMGGLGGAGGAMSAGPAAYQVPRAGGGGGGGGGGLFARGGKGGAGGESYHFADTTPTSGKPGLPGSPGTGYGGGGGGGGGASRSYGNNPASPGGKGGNGANGCIFIIEDWGSVS